MDWLTVATIAGSFGVGSALTGWIMSLKMDQLEEEIAKLKEDQKDAVKIVETERTIDAARDLDPLAELHKLSDAASEFGPRASDPDPGRPKV